MLHLSPYECPLFALIFLLEPNTVKVVVMDLHFFLFPSVAHNSSIFLLLMTTMFCCYVDYTRNWPYIEMFRFCIINRGKLYLPVEWVLIENTVYKQADSLQVDFCI